MVREQESIEITKKELLVTHESATPSEILYVVTKVPVFGEVVNGEGESVRQFTQADIIHQNIKYRNTLSSLVDVFQVNVTNHFTTIQNIKISVEITPVIIPLR